MPFAYIDPGSGSMLIQVILASALAVPFFFRRTIGDVWHRFRGEREATTRVDSGEETDTRT